MTGAPSQHGIVGNEWWDKKEGRAIYAVEDAERWRGPVNLECPTLGDALKASSTASLVVSVSGKDRAAILMGGHKADLALWYDRSSGQFVTSGVYGRMPDWVWLWDDALRIPVDQREKIASTPRLDAMTLELAAKAIEQSRLGGRGVPDLLAISLSVTDILGHAYGPDSPQMREQLLALDKSLGAFFDGLDRRFGRDGYALALSADHGVTPLPEMSAAPGALRLISKGLERDLETALRAKLGAPPKAGASWVLDVHSPYVYLDLEAADAANVGSSRLVEAASDWLLRQPSVAPIPPPIGGRRPAGRTSKFRRSYRGRSNVDGPLQARRDRSRRADGHRAPALRRRAYRRSSWVPGSARPPRQGSWRPTWRRQRGCSASAWRPRRARSSGPVGPGGKRENGGARHFRKNDAAVVLVERLAPVEFLVDDAVEVEHLIEMVELVLSVLLGLMPFSNSQKVERVRRAWR